MRKPAGGIKCRASHGRSLVTASIRFVVPQIIPLLEHLYFTLPAQRLRALASAEQGQHHVSARRAKSRTWYRDRRIVSNAAQRIARAAGR